MEDNNITATKPQVGQVEQKSRQFFDDVLSGLKSCPKQLDSKYFYDQAGDKLFQEIMECPEYYPTNCEMEIFAEQTAALCQTLIESGDDIDLIELGAGDATKSSFLLKYLLEANAGFTYLPIDISANIISYLNLALPVSLPGIKVEGLNGEYFAMMKKAAAISNKRKVVLFLGSNIGNMNLHAAEGFCKELRNQLSPGDMVLMGFDLKKNPKTILAAYNDRGGITKKFNLNLLTRINRELNANFDTNQFDHYAAYNPETGACKSYLISLTDQTVNIGNEQIRFEKDEYIDMEISQKFAVEQTALLARSSGFETYKNFFDAKRWFLDTVWIAR